MKHADNNPELLPWMRDAFSRLASLEASGKLAHAYLLGGQEGLGKRMLARYFAHYLLCRNRQGDAPCGECRECQLLAAETHPDLKIIQPEDSAEIKIDQVRGTIEFISRTSQRGGWKIILLCPAEAMNTNSANALLKVLEEPSPRTLLLLVSHQPALLMATIRSRCHALKFNRPAPEQVMPWLEAKNVRAAAELLRMAHNVPLRALHLADEDAAHDRTVLHDVLEEILRGRMDIAEAASACDQFSLADNIEGLMLCTVDIIAHNQGRDHQAVAPPDDHDLGALAAFFSDRTKLKALHEFYRELVTARRAVKSTTNPNPGLMLESLFYRWAAIAR